LFLFLDIPQQHVARLYIKCEKFVKNYISMGDLIAKNELAGYESSDDENDLDDQLKTDLNDNEEEEENLLK